MSFLTKWFRTQKTTKSKVYSSSEDDNIMSDEENLTIAHSSLPFNALKQIEQNEKKQHKQFEQLNVCVFFHSNLK
jgi:hypothetical protein